MIRSGQNRLFMTNLISSRTNMHKLLSGGIGVWEIFSTGVEGRNNIHDLQSLFFEGTRIEICYGRNEN